MWTGCNQYRSMTTASKISDLSGNPFYRTLSKSMMKNIDEFLKEQGQKKSLGKVNFETTLRNFLTTSEQWVLFKKMIGDFYKISDMHMDQQFASLTSVKDLIQFTARYGTKFPPCYG